MRFFVNGSHNILLIVGIACCMYALPAFYHQFAFTCDFHLRRIDLVCQQPSNNRCDYAYTGLQPDGSVVQVHLSYMLAPNTVEIGNTIEKKRFHFSYRVNGTERKWDSATHYVRVLLSGIAALCAWYFFARRRSRAKS